MKRRVFKILYTLSLVLALALSALWVRSYWRADELSRSWQTAGGRVASFRVLSERGGLGIRHIRAADNDFVSGFGWYFGSHSADMFPEPPPSFGFKSGNVQYFGLSKFEARAPYWVLILLTAFPLAMRFAFAVRRRLRVRWRKCIACGYDLRASKDKCPECGATIESKSAA